MAGETTTALTADSWRNSQVVPAFKGPALHVHQLATATYSNTNQLENTDVMEVDYLPPGLKVWGFIVSATDMDTHGTPTLAQKIVVGSTDVVTGITNGRDGSTSFHALPTPYTTTGIELVKIVNTAASATGATGSVILRVVYTAP